MSANWTGVMPLPLSAFGSAPCSTRRRAEGGLPVVVAPVGLGAAGEELAGGLLVAVVAGEHEEGLPVLVGEVHGQAGLDHGQKRLGLPVAGVLEGLQLELAVAFLFGGSGGRIVAHGGQGPAGVGRRQAMPAGAAASAAAWFSTPTARATPSA
jgi:hypothetical protein